MSNPIYTADTATQRALQERIEAGVRAGAAHLPLEERPKSEVRTYNPKDVKITFNGIEIKGFAEGSFVEVDVTPSESGAEMQTYASSTAWVFVDERRAQKARRKIHRARMRARKRRRGW